MTLRWTLDEKTATDQAPLLSISPYVCSQHGVFEIEVQATSTDASALGEIAKRQTYPCFPPAFDDPEGSVDGPNLEPGNYRVEVRGLRRSGEPWDYSEDSPVFQQLGPIAFASFSTTIEKDKTTEHFGIQLNVPPACDDGIDNDRDGVIDQLDIGCQDFPEQANAEESNESRVSLIQPIATILGGLEQPSGPALGISQIAVHLTLLPTELGQDCQLSSAPPIDFLACTNTDDPLTCRTLKWSDSLPLLEYELDGGCYGLGLTGGSLETQADDSKSFVPITHTSWTNFLVVPGSANFVEHQVDFNFDQFLSPQTWPIGWSPSIRPTPDINLTGCTFEQQHNTRFEVLSYQMRFWDEQIDRSQELAELLGEDATITPDGWVDLPCSKVSRLYKLGEFVWTNFFEIEMLAFGHQLDIPFTSNTPVQVFPSLQQGRDQVWNPRSFPTGDSDVNPAKQWADNGDNGELCYGQAGLRFLLTPFILNDVPLDRILLENGQPPPACIDCLTDDDCRNATCMQSICVPNDG